MKTKKSRILERKMFWKNIRIFEVFGKVQRCQKCIENPIYTRTIDIQVYLSSNEQKTRKADENPSQ